MPMSFHTLSTLLISSSLIGTAFFFTHATATPTASLSKAQTLIDQAQNSRALVYLTDFIDRNPTNVKAYLMRALVCERLGEYQKQLSDLTLAIKLSPKSADLYTRRATAFYNSWQLKKAIEDCNESIKLNSSNSWKALSIAALACDESGQHEKAIAYRTKALLIDESDPLLWFNRAENHESLGRSDAALSDRIKAVKLFTAADRLNMQSCKPFLNFEQLADNTSQISIEKQLKRGEIDIRFHYDSEGHIYMPLEVNGQTLLFMLDTGSAHSTIWKQSLPGAARIETVAFKNVETTKQDKLYGFFKAANFRLGELMLKNIWLPVTPGLGAHELLGGFLGGNILSNFVVTINYAKKEIILSNSSKDLKTSNSIVLPMLLRHHRPHCEVSLNDDVKVMALIDTGCPSSLSAASLLNSILTTKLVPYQRISGPSIGALWAESIRLKTINFNGFRLSKPIIDVFLQREAPQVATEVIIGGDVLSRFKAVTFDFPKREIVFEPSSESANSASSSFHEGQYYFQHNQQQQAATSFTESMAMDSDFAIPCYRNRSTAFINLGKFKKAVEDCTALIKLDPRDASNYFQRAWSYQGLHAYGQQITDDTKALALDPTYLSAYQNRAWAYDRMGKHQLARQDRKKAASLGSKL